ncbi:hypothetical protein TWF506_007321 [Arthrobotrys conoides]|uniref:Uncharacterized protein n=1 Tax=Arthrobotrys conoides TaxID=74498 RepID=A0AAN8RSQ0_9PEZI
MLPFATFLVLAVCSLSHAFLLAQTLQPRPGGDVKESTIENEIFEDPGIDPQNAVIKPNSQRLEVCNLRTGFSRGNKLGKAKKGSRWDRMGDPKSIRYLAVVNWGDTLPLEAIAFYSSTRCRENSLVMMIRFFPDEDTAQIVHLTESYVPRNLTAWKAISIQDPDALYSNPRVAKLASSMIPGSVYIPVPGRAPMTADAGLDPEGIYCTGLVHRAKFSTYSIANLRKTGMLDLRNLVLRIKDQIKTSEDPNLRKYNFRCIPVNLRDGELGGGIGGIGTGDEDFIDADDQGSFISTKGERTVQAIIASEFPWDEGVDLTKKRTPNEIADAIIDLDSLEEGEGLSVTLKKALTRLGRIKQQRAARRKKYPAITAADLDINQGEEQQQDPNAIVIPDAQIFDTKKRLKLFPQFDLRKPGKLGKKIVKLLGGDENDPFGFIGIDTTALLGDPIDDFRPQMPDLRKQYDYDFAHELSGILNSMRPKEKVRVSDLVSSPIGEGTNDDIIKKEEYNPVRASPGSDVEEIIKEEEGDRDSRIEEEQIYSPYYDAGTVLPASITPEDTKEEEGYSTRAQYVGETEPKQEEPEVGDDPNISGSIKAEYEDSVMKEEEIE